MLQTERKEVGTNYGGTTYGEQLKLDLVGEIHLVWMNGKESSLYT